MTKLHKVTEHWVHQRLLSARLLANDILGSASRRIPLFGQVILRNGPFISLGLHRNWASELLSQYSA